MGAKSLQPLDRLCVAPAAEVGQSLGEDEPATRVVVFRVGNAALGQPFDAREIHHRVGRQCAGLGRPFRDLGLLGRAFFEAIEQLTASAAIALDVAGVQVQRRGMVPVLADVGVQLQRLVEVRDRLAEAAGLAVEVATTVVEVRIIGLLADGIAIDVEGLGVPAEGVVAVGQVVHAHERVGVVGAELGLFKRQRLLAELEGVGVPAEGGVAVGQVVHARASAGWSGPSLAFLERQRLFEELEGVGVPAELGVAVGQVVHAPKRVGVVGAELGFLQGQRLLAELEGVGVPAEGGVADWPGCSCSRACRGGRGRAWPS